MNSELLKTVNISKNFGGVRALKGVDFILNQGDALALIGENGAGKSTLMKVISGVYPHNEFNGEIHLHGTPVSFSNTKDAETAGIAIIHQELNLFNELSVGENIFLSNLPTSELGKINYQLMNEQSQQILDRLGVKVKATDKCGDLNTGNQQMVEIAKAISKNAKILILDEPTSSLTKHEIEKLFHVIKELKRNGMSIIYISHKLDEVFELCSTVTVLRDGESVFNAPINNLTHQDIIKHMVGRELKSLYPEKNEKAKEDATPYLEINNWSAYKISEKKYRVKNASLKAYRGEILGISGLMGAGRTDLLNSLFGHHNYQTTGEIKLNGKTIEINSPSEAIKAGLALVTEDRKGNGLHLDFSIRENISMANLKSFTNSFGKINEDKISKTVEKLIAKLHIKIPSPLHQVKTLSGGNQQKVAIAKWLATNPKVLFLDEPTRGIDVGAKFEIYSLLNELVEEGMLIIIASSELPEIIGMCNRVVVMKEGELTECFTGKSIKEQEIMEASIG